MTCADNTGHLRERKPFDHYQLAHVTTGLELNDLASLLPQIGQKKETHRMTYSSAQRCFEANIIEMSSHDVQTDIASNLSKGLSDLSKGLSELTVSLAANIQDLRTQLKAVREELDALKAERRPLLI
jgi:hypothetical protein